MCFEIDPLYDRFQHALVHFYWIEPMIAKVFYKYYSPTNSFNSMLPGYLNKVQIFGKGDKKLKNLIKKNMSSMWQGNSRIIWRTTLRKFIEKKIM